MSHFQSPGTQAGAGPGGTPVAYNPYLRQAGPVPGMSDGPGTPYSVASPPIVPSMMRPRPKDGSELCYLDRGPSNRLTLSLKSGIGSQVDWALNRLINVSFEYPDSIALEQFPGLADALVQLPRRVCHAMHGEPAHMWDPRFFEQSHYDALLSFDGGRHLQQQQPPRKRARMQHLQGTETGGRLSSLVSLAGTTGDAIDEVPPSLSAFDPAHDPEHAALMRRAVEAALILRNLNVSKDLWERNSRSLLAVKGFATLIKDILELPDIILTVPSSSVPSAGKRVQVKVGALQEELEGWLELEGINELRLYFLDLLECIASKIIVTRRAPFEVSASGELIDLAGTEAYSDTQPNGRPAKPGNGIFLRLLHFANHSRDRALLLGSLRCLGVIAANERNEAAFVELETTEGNLSPGLLRRCVELLCVTYDNDLLEAALELLYQLVSVGNNGLRLACRSITNVTTAAIDAARMSASAMTSASTSASAMPATGATGTNATSNHASTASGVSAIVRLLVRDLSINKTVWERDHALASNSQAWAREVPSRLRADALAKIAAAEQRHRAKARRSRLTAEESIAEKRLTARERQRLMGMKEPERSVEWMKMVFEAEDGGEVTQIEFWNAYKEEMATLIELGEVPMQPAGDLIRQVSQVFPKSQAMVLPPVGGMSQRFVIRGVEVRDRSRRTETNCKWTTCRAPETTSIAAANAHAVAHAKLATDGRCRWLSCTHVESRRTIGTGAEQQQQRRALVEHVQTHLRTPPPKEDVNESESAPRQQKRRLPPAHEVVAHDDDGVPVLDAPLTLPRPARSGIEVEAVVMRNGARVLRGKDGALDMAGAHVRPIANLRPVQPDRRTLDEPGVLTFTVARTPMDPQAAAVGTGSAAAAALVLRSLARTAATTLDRAGVRSSKGNSINGSEDGKGDASGEEGDPSQKDGARGAGDERFGLPIPPTDAEVGNQAAAAGSAEASMQRRENGVAAGGVAADNRGPGDGAGERHAAKSAAASTEDHSGAGEGSGTGMMVGVGGAESRIGPVEDWAVQAALRLIDALVAVEDDLVFSSAENDVLCKTINDTLLELRPERVPSVLSRPSMQEDQQQHDGQLGQQGGAQQMEIDPAM